MRKNYPYEISWESIHGTQYSIIIYRWNIYIAKHTASQIVRRAATEPYQERTIKVRPLDKSDPSASAKKKKEKNKKKGIQGTLPLDLK